MVETKVLSVSNQVTCVGNSPGGYVITWSDDAINYCVDGDDVRGVRRQTNNTDSDKHNEAHTNTMSWRLQFNTQTQRLDCCSSKLLRFYVCKFVCLCGRKKYSKSCWWIFIKFLVETNLGTRNNWLDFGDDLDVGYRYRNCILSLLKVQNKFFLNLW